MIDPRFPADGCEITEPVPGYPVLRVRHEMAGAAIALHGAHLMEWTPAGLSNVLYCSPLARFEPGRAIRGGIPICWPVFGAPPPGSGLPAHGLARNRFWKWDHITTGPRGVLVCLSLSDDPETRAIWPHAFRLRMEFSIGTTLRARLRVHNPGPSAIAFGGALHTYLACADIHAAHLDGLDGHRYDDTVPGREGLKEQNGAIRFTEETDRIYEGAPGGMIHDPAGRRRVRVVHEGATHVVVWNPWEEKARRLGDLPEDGWKHFLCVESTLARPDQILLEAGAWHDLGVEISVP